MKVHSKVYNFNIYIYILTLPSDGVTYNSSLCIATYNNNDLVRVKHNHICIIYCQKHTIWLLQNRSYVNA